MSDIYFLYPDVSFSERLVYTGGMRLESILCPENEGLPSQHAMRQKWSSPIKVISPVHAMHDFEWTVYRDILIGENTINKLNKASFSGVEYRASELFTTTETPIGRQVFEIKVSGWGGIASASSGIQLKEKCKSCGRSVYAGDIDGKNLFDIDKWDGSDFFLIWPLPRYIFITQEVASLFLSEGFTGVKVCELNKFPKSISKTYTPGHIEDWYEKDKAQEILRMSTF